MTAEMNFDAAAGTSVSAQAPRRTVALAGNPNVGKSSVFNGLTGMNQHTGNWPGKTVSSARGKTKSRLFDYELFDIPGAYSLLAHSEEEAIARDFLCFQGVDAVLIVCDATCLVRNMHLALQILELHPRALLCVNLMDQAEKRGFSIDLSLLSERLHIPVVGVCAHEVKSLSKVKSALDALFTGGEPSARAPAVAYAPPIEEALSRLMPALCDAGVPESAARFWALRLIEGDEAFLAALAAWTDASSAAYLRVRALLNDAKAHLLGAGLAGQSLQDAIANAIAHSAKNICRGAVHHNKPSALNPDRKVDRLVLSRRFGFPLMLLLLSLVFFLTISGANVPSALLSRLFLSWENGLRELFIVWNAPPFLTGVLIDGMFRVLSFVVAVMLPPMAIFFPLFTLLEDLGYLPRVAFNLDKCFQCCHACGKQALTMCMGFGCNAAGVVGCRIIDSPREKLIAMLTNCFVPCNGRFAPPLQGKECHCFCLMDSKKHGAWGRRMITAASFFHRDRRYRLSPVTSLEPGLTSFFT